MNRNQIWKLILPVLAAGLVCARPALAQSSQSAGSSTNSFIQVYDVTKEVKVEGTIQKIETQTPNLPMGTHVLIQTTQGVIDAHLGAGPAAKPSFLGISEGEDVTLVGMMQTVGGNQILLTRLLTTPSHIFVLRNEHGIPVRGNPNRSPAAAKTQKGGL